MARNGKWGWVEGREKGMKEGTVTRVEAEEVSLC